MPEKKKKDKKEEKAQVTPKKDKKDEKKTVLANVETAGKWFKALEDEESNASDKDTRSRITERKVRWVQEKTPDIKALLEYYPGYDYPDKKGLISLIVNAYHQVNDHDIPDVAELRDNRKIITDKVRAGGRALTSLNDQLRVNALMTSRQKSRERRKLLQSYEPEIKSFLLLYPRRDYPKIDSQPIDILLSAYDDYKKTPLTEEGEAGSDLLTTVKNKAYKRDQRSNDDEAQKRLNANISGAQKEGLREIAKWMYRNSEDTGAISIGPSQERFVRMILNLPARMKLLMYYLIENKKRHNPTAEDILVSQTDYVPNLQVFKERMIATKFKFWKRVDGSYVYWNKLEETLQIARSGSDLLAAFGDMGSPDAVDRLRDNLNAANEALQGKGANKNARGLEGMKEVERNQALSDFMDRLKLHKEILSSRDKEKNKKDGHEEQWDKTVNQSSRELIKAYMKLAGIDKNMESEEGFSSTAGEKAETYAGYGGTGIGIGKHVNKVEKVASFMSWHIGDLHLENMNLSSGIFTTVGGAAALASAIAGIVNIARSAGEETREEAAEKIIGIVQNFSGIASTLVSGAYTIKNAGIVGAAAVSQVGKAALSAADKAGGAASIVTGTVDIIAGYYKTGKAEAQRKMAQEAYKKMDGLSDQDKAKTKDILRLQSRISDSKGGSGVVKAISGSLQILSGVLAMAGVTAPAAAIISGIATAVNLAVSVKEYFERKKNRQETIDSYIKMDKIEALVKRGLLERYGPQAGGNAAAAIPGNLRDQIRSEVVACLGFSSEDTLYVHITRNYARFLIQNTFYKDGQVTTESDEKTPNQEAYGDMIRSFGLKPIYPKTSADDPKPDIDTLAKKMVI